MASSTAARNDLDIAEDDGEAADGRGLIDAIRLADEIGVPASVLTYLESRLPGVHAIADGRRRLYRSPTRRFSQARRSPLRRRAVVPRGAGNLRSGRSKAVAQARPRRCCAHAQTEASAAAPPARPIPAGRAGPSPRPSRTLRRRARRAPTRRRSSPNSSSACAFWRARGRSVSDHLSRVLTPVRPLRLACEARVALAAGRGVARRVVRRGGGGCGGSRG